MKRAYERSLGMRGLLAVATAATLLAGSAAFASAPPGWVQANNRKHGGKSQQQREDESMKPAPLVRSLGKTIELRVGEKQSFRPVQMAGVIDPKVARIMVDEGVLTIRGLKSGSTTLHIFAAGAGAPSADGLAKPREIKVTVK